MIFPKHIKILSLVLVLIMAFILPFAFALCYALVNIGSWIVVADNPPDSGIKYLFTFNGENVRERYAAILMSKYTDAVWLCSNNNKDYKSELAEKGVDTGRVRLIYGCTSTHSEAIALSDMVGSIINESSSVPIGIGLISGPYHTRRILLEMRHHFPFQKADLYFLPVPFEYYSVQPETYRNWWKEKPLRELILFEIKKIIYG